MSDSITDQAAIAFSVAFYESLGNGEDIESAYKFACAEIALLNLKEEHIPKLLQRIKTEIVSVQRNVNSHVEKIRQLIAADRLEKASEEFLARAAGTAAKIQKEVIAHQAALAKATKEQRRGLLNAD
jgi:hypothetical protein